MTNHQGLRKTLPIRGVLVPVGLHHRHIVPRPVLTWEPRIVTGKHGTDPLPVRGEGKQRIPLSLSILTMATARERVRHRRCIQ